MVVLLPCVGGASSGLDLLLVQVQVLRSYYCTVVLLFRIHKNSKAQHKFLLRPCERSLWCGLCSARGGDPQRVLKNVDVEGVG